MNKISRFIASLFYIGYIPYMPGTFGTVFSFFVLWFLLKPIFLSFFSFLMITILSVFICDIAEKSFAKKDDARIVLDEFVGSFFSVIFLPKIFFIYFFAFLMFRLFDILKPFGIKKLQNIKGGLGIVIDDVFAGILANLMIVIVFKILLKSY